MNMPKGLKILTAAFVAGLVLIGTASYADGWDNGRYGPDARGYQDGSYMQGRMADRFEYDNNGSSGGYGMPRGMMGGYRHGMMGGYYGSNSPWNLGNGEAFNEDDLMSVDDLIEQVENYLKYYDGSFEIADIFVYSNSDYYFSIVEEDTGRGAMELLVNPINGYVYPEHGPNMMWNTEYGMHARGPAGHMRGFGGYWSYDYDQEDQLSAEDALERASDYVDRINSDLAVEDNGHHFYGYFTFHVTEGDETVGMLSVNAYTGDVWYHDWHGEIIEIISEHHDD